ncbi:MAG: sulfatase-like hydrolase/transferase [Kiritimatiellae bacterium]|nr:sulfatase-like hydrolase/transferase [Kiritimatiellia bacterium]
MDDDEPADVGALVAMWFAVRTNAAPAPPHVLLILADDLKPALGCYGDLAAVTPHVEFLAARGRRFERAYCHAALCAPSRFHLMLSAHSTSRGLYGLGRRLRSLFPGAVTRPQHFARYGRYRTKSLGKVFHVGHGNEGGPASFSVPPLHDRLIEYVDSATAASLLTREAALFENRERSRIGELPRGPAWEAPDVPDEAHADARIAAEAVRWWEVAAERARRDRTRAFLAVGLVRPHLPFALPRRYWQMVDPTKLPRPTTHALLRGAPAIAGRPSGEIENYEPIGTDVGVTPEAEQ